MGCIVLREVALKVTGFKRAAAGEVLRVEVEHHPLAFVVGETHLLAFVVDEIKSRRRRSHSRNFVDCAGTIAGQHRYDREHQNKSILTHSLTSYTDYCEN